MKTLIIVILSLPVFYPNDYLLQAIYSDYKEPEPVNELINSDDSYSSEAEAYSWELGSPDNIPETVIIYFDEPSPCELTYR